ncbi:hypothetical protein Rsub_11881 [Raphidocelis subcapitata]|uniref:Uncharacterized protein n=1 Tax=Raphidocelis subcapitata TaxID=307507 RepID=A0A2V0PFC6_9CHLO|nr:hypothetical protein Rsub_11881 [Raphidocelis subcapitata]|eukprot:GBF98551.1 hypothetical protein Rsub_11881 [Raphidocelis subcapitata]
MLRARVEGQPHEAAGAAGAQRRPRRRSQRGGEAASAPDGGGARLLDTSVLLARDPGGQPDGATAAAALAAALGALTEDAAAAAAAEQLLAVLQGAEGPGVGGTAAPAAAAAALQRPRAVVAAGARWSAPAGQAVAAAVALAVAAAAVAARPHPPCVAAVVLFPSATALLAALPAVETAAAAAADAVAADDGSGGEDGDGGGSGGGGAPLWRPALGVQMWVGGASYASEQSAARAAPPQVLLATPGRMRQHLEDERLRWGPAFQGLKLVVVAGAESFLAPGSNLRPELEGALRHLLPRSPSDDGPQLLLLAPPSAADAARRFCSALPQLGGRVALAELSSGESAAAPNGSAGGLDTPAPLQHQQPEQEQREQQGQQQQPQAPSALVVPQHLLLTQLAVAVRRHLVGRRAAKVVVEFRGASEAALCSRLFRLLLKLPTLELHSRKTLSYRRSVIESFAAQRTAVLFATPAMAEALVAQAAGGGGSSGGVTLHVKVGLPVGALPRAAAAPAAAGGGPAAAAAWEGSDGGAAVAAAAGEGGGGTAAARLLLLLDFEAAAIAARRRAAGGAAGGSSGTAPAVAPPPQQRAAPPDELQQRLDALAAALGAGAAAARVRELASLQPSVSAALRRVPAARKDRAYVAWLSQHMSAARDLGWSRQAVAAAAAVYAQSLGCEERPLVPWAVAAKMGVQDLAEIRVGPRGSSLETGGKSSGGGG